MGSRTAGGRRRVGFWRTTPYVVLEHGFDYPELDVYLDQFILLDQDGSISVYRNWFQNFTRESIVQELKSGGFKCWAALEATSRVRPYRSDSEWIGLVARPDEADTRTEYHPELLYHDKHGHSPVNVTLRTGFRDRRVSI